MTELLANHGEQTGGQVDSKWDRLKDIPMNDEKAHDVNRETDSQQYETELTAPADVLEDVQKYVIKDEKVYSKETRQEESDEDTILRIKTSKFIFNEAKALRDEQAHMFGDRFSDKGPQYYVDKILERYGFKDEGTQFAEGRLLKDLVDSGVHHQTMSGDNLSGSKYDMFIGEKGDFGKALLRRRLRQHGLEMTDIKVSMDSSTFVKDGYSTVDIRVDTLPIKESDDIIENHAGLHHPAAEQLSKLESGLAEALKDGDEVAINGYRAALKMTVERNPLEVSPEEWDKMSNTQRERFYRLKMKEAKILGDKDSFDFWEANLRRLNDSLE